MKYLTITRGSKCSMKVSLLNIVLILYMCKQSCTNFATAVGISTSITAGIILISFLCLFLIYFFTHLREIKWDGIILILLCAVFFVITIHLHPEYKLRYEDVYNDGRFSAKSVFALGSGFYVYYIFRMFGDDTDGIYQAYSVIPYIVFFLNLPTLLNRNSEYAMDFGYQMEFAAIMFLAMFLYEDAKHKSKLVFSLIAMLLGVLYGARSSILGYLFFITFYLVWNPKVTLGRIALVGVAVIGVIVYNSRMIMMSIYNLFASLGLSSRTLYLIATGDILADDYARQERIWPALINLLQESSIFEMYGAYGDRYFIDAYYPYAHNIVLELLVTFGKFVGGILIILIVYHFIKTCIRNKDKGGILTLAFGCFSICRLMVSSSFWIEPYFWAFLAMMVNCAVLYRRESSYSIFKLRGKRV